MNRPFFLALSALIFISCAGSSQSIDKAKLDAYFNTLTEHNRFMGSVAIAQGGELIYSKTVGFADVEQGLKANENTLYRIGSITKTFTAVLVLKAVEENKLSLNQTIDKWFPNIGNADKITIDQMLRHRSGLHNHLDEWVNSGRHIQAITEQEMIETITQSGNDFTPDAQTAYSNSGYYLLTFILERIYQKPFSEILEEKIVRPLGLKNTRLGGKINSQNNECHSYIFLGNSWQRLPEAHTSQLLGAGAIISTPTDLVKFSHALFSGKLISENSLQQMKTIQDHFGMGLKQFPFHHRIGFGHTGGIDGFRSIFAYFPDGDFSIAITSNDMNPNLNEIAITLLNVAYGKTFEIPEFTALDTTEVDLSQFVGVYSSPQLPLKMTISVRDNQLFGQGTGQPAFPLEMTAENKFEFRQAGVVLEFNPANNSMILRQGGGVFSFTRED